VDELVLTNRDIAKVEETDVLYAARLRESKRNAMALLRQVPGYLQAVLNVMAPEDTYRAKISKEVLKKLQTGGFEKVINKDTGLWTGIIRKSDGKEIICQTKWEKVDFNQQALSNITSVAMHASIAELTEQILALDKKLDFLLSTSHSDRVARVKAGIDMYQAAVHYQDPSMRNHQLSNALQTLYNGRRFLMGELEVVLKLSPRNATLLDRVWLLMGLNKPDVDLFREFETRYPVLQETVKYINLSSAYIFRIHMLLDAFSAAEESKRQYVAFCSNLLSGLDRNRGYLPHSFVSEAQSFGALSDKVQSGLSIESDVVIEVTYEELPDGKM
jgi:hypothetical protein